MKEVMLSTPIPFIYAYIAQTLSEKLYLAYTMCNKEESCHLSCCEKHQY